MKRILIVLFVLFSAPTVRAEEFYELSQPEIAFIQILNLQRAKARLPELKVCPKLSAKCRAWSAHTARVGWRGQSSHMPKAKRGNFRENMAIGTGSGRGVFNMWRGSPGHNATMFSRSTQCGIGLYNGIWTFQCGGGTPTQIVPIPDEPVVEATPSQSQQTYQTKRQPYRPKRVRLFRGR